MQVVPDGSKAVERRLLRLLFICNDALPAHTRRQVLLRIAGIPQGKGAQLMMVTLAISG
jgi:hypothetical protein